MSVRAKFQLREKHDKGWTTTLIFETQYDEQTPEDQRFETATPTGKIEMNCNNPAANDQMEVNKQYYVDFTECPDQA